MGAMWGETGTQSRERQNISWLKQPSVYIISTYITKESSPALSTQCPMWVNTRAHWTVFFVEQHPEASAGLVLVKVQFERVQDPCAADDSP